MWGGGCSDREKTELEQRPATWGSLAQSGPSLGHWSQNMQPGACTLLPLPPPQRREVRTGVAAHIQKAPSSSVVGCEVWLGHFELNRDCNMASRIVGKGFMFNSRLQTVKKHQGATENRRSGGLCGRQHFSFSWHFCGHMSASKKCLGRNELEFTQGLSNGAMLALPLPPPPGDAWLSQLGEGALLAPAGRGPGMLLSSLQCTGHPTRVTPQRAEGEKP